MLFDFDKGYNRIQNYASIYHSGAFYIFGGYPDTSKISRFDPATHSWSLAGNLRSKRLGHGVVFDGWKFLVIGGSGSYKTENCILKGTVMTCTEQESPALNNYRYSPALFLTASNYGDYC